jgi:hypothetical protein
MVTAFVVIPVYHISAGFAPFIWADFKDLLPSNPDAA